MSSRPSRTWRVRGTLPPRLYLAIAFTGLALPLALWMWLSTSGAVDRVFMPSPLDVLARLVDWALEDGLAEDIRVSVGRVLGGFMLSAVLALPLALMIGTYKPVQAFFEPLTDFIRYMPAVAFIPLVMIWVGIDEGSKIAIIFIGTFFQMTLMMAEDVRRVPMPQIEAAQTMGATRGEIMKFVILPSAWPALLDTLRVTMGWAWTYLVVAEIVAASSGLGYMIMQSQRFLKTSHIIVGILVIGVIGIIIDLIFKWLYGRLFPWMGKGGAA